MLIHTFFISQVNALLITELTPSPFENSGYAPDKYSLIFCAKMFRYSQIIYCLRDESTNFRTKTFKLSLVFIYLKKLQNLKIIYYWYKLRAFWNLSALSVKIGSTPSSHLLEYHNPSINLLLVSFLSALGFSNLFYQVKSLTWIIVSGSS